MLATALITVAVVVVVLGTLIRFVPGVGSDGAENAADTPTPSRAPATGDPRQSFWPDARLEL